MRTTKIIEKLVVLEINWYRQILCCNYMKCPSKQVMVSEVNSVSECVQNEEKEDEYNGKSLIIGIDL